MSDAWIGVVLGAALPLAVAVRPAGGGQDEALALGADLSLGKVVDREGIGLLRGPGEARWRAADEHAPLAAGDWLRTGTRGAHALELRLRDGTPVTLGPGAQIELVDAARLRVLAGEVAVGAAPGRPIALESPGAGALELESPAVVCARDGRLDRLADEPAWLRGWRAGQPTEALGSLLATIDGRDVPLTLGDVKVTVDVRDQIARTVVESTFLNHTSRELEGVFHFPLPADASISSFGMWIGDELVEGDIVEKERARSIYEQILREKRDPGLLEWTGGNLFKARVWPILGEKRIKLSWTQVLPARDGVHAWHYALQSELLRRTPLRRLAIDVHVRSAEPLTAVACPSHACRIETAAHSATVSFAAEEFRPDRDFELRIATRNVRDEIARRPAELSFVDDVRDHDGFFMVRCTPPAVALPDTPPPPTDWLLLCDTSGSMRGPARSTQLEFVEALLASLGEHDTFQLATCDGTTRFAFPAPVANDAASRAAALRFVEQREPLGWSDLAAAFEQAFPALRDATQLVYVGDGIPSAHDPDPADCADRIARAFPGRGRVHAVVPGNAQEPRVLRAAAALGDGSLRAIGGGSDATQVAQALLADVTRPRATGLRLEFDGLPVAAIHPEPPRTLLAGEQAIVVGRFDARTASRGTLRFSGRGADGAEFRREIPVVLDDLGGKDSFVPRLWARRHLDHLLAQPTALDLKRRILGLSEEFQIVTPYSSFLVLESEADRERFAVEKRTRMRDGEEFFAQGRADAAFELAQLQIVRAKAWRAGLRDETLALLAGLARAATEELRPQSYASAIALGGGSGGVWKETGVHARSASPVGVRAKAAEELRELGYEDETRSDDGAPEPTPFAMPAGERAAPAGDDAFEPAESSAEEPELANARAGLDDARDAKRGLLKQSRAEGLVRGHAGPADELAATRLGRLLAAGGSKRVESGLRRAPPPDPLAPLFQDVAPPPTPPAPAFDGEVGELLRAIDLRARIAALADGFAIGCSSQETDARGRTTPGPQGRWWRSPTAWYAEPLHRAGDDVAIDWLHDGARGRWLAAWLHGRVRTAVDGDAAATPLPPLFPFLDAGNRFRGADARLEALERGLVRITFTWKHLEPDSRARSELVVDPARRLALSTTDFDAQGTVTARASVEEVVEVGGAAWPSRVVEAWPVAGLAAERRFTFAHHDAAGFARGMAQLLAPRAELIELGELPASVAAARNAVAAGRAGIAERWLLLRDALARDDAAAARAEFAALPALAAGRRALARIELGVLHATRDHETLRLRLLARAAELAATPQACDLARVHDLLELAGPLARGDERLALLRALEPVALRQPDAPGAAFAHRRRIVAELQPTARQEEAAAAAKQLAGDFPLQHEAHLLAAQHEANAGELDAAIERLARALAEHAPWSESQRSALVDARLGWQWHDHRLEAIESEVAALLRERPSAATELQLARYLSSLVMLDREREWWSRIGEWLDAGAAAARIGTPLAPDAARRLSAAVAHALGQSEGCWWWWRRYSAEQARVLVEAAGVLLDHDAPASFGMRLLGDHVVGETLAAREFRVRLWERATAGIETAPAPRLARWIDLLRLRGHEPAGGEAEWRALHGRLLARLRVATDERERSVLEATLLRHAPHEVALEVLRDGLARAATDEARRAAVAALFARLLEGDWTAAREAEAAGHATDVLAWHDWLDWALEGRTKASVEARPDFLALPKRRLAAVQDVARREACTALRERLAARIAAAPDDPLAAWWRLDRAWLEAELKADLRAAWNESLALLDALLEAREPPADAVETPERALRRLERSVLARRAAFTLLHALATGDAATRAEDERALRQRIDACIARDDAPIDGREFDVLRMVALDRAGELEERLAAWLGDGSDATLLRFGRLLAWVRAERGKLDEAAALAWRLHARQALDEEDLLALAGWCTALSRREEADRARLAAWRTLDQDALGRRLDAASRRLADRGDGTPGSLEPEVFEQLVVLLAKSSRPHAALGRVRDFYGRTKDARLVEGLAEGMVGHTAQGVYGLLQQLVRDLSLLDEEAAVDAIGRGLARARAVAASDLDRRALDYLESIARWRAAAQESGGGVHERAALAAMRSAFVPARQPGEAVALAAFLASLSDVRVPTLELESEQLRQLAALLAEQQPGSEERLAVADSFATAQWNARESEASIRTLEAELRARRDAAGGRLPQTAHGALATLADRLARAGRWLDGERWLQEAVAAAANPAQRHALERQLHGYWAKALRAGGSVSHGRSAALFGAAREAIVAKLLERAEEGRAAALVEDLMALFEAAHAGKLARVREELERFATATLPRILALDQQRSASAIVTHVASRLRDIAGAASAVEFLVTRAENEARWLERIGQSFWQQQGWTLAQWRKQAGRLDERLERRLLALVVEELRAGLRHGDERTHGITRRGWDGFWSGKADDFAVAALMELRTEPDDEAVARRVATYLHDGVDRPRESIEVLRQRARGGRLGHEGRRELCHRLVRHGGAAEALPLLDALIATWPDDFEMRWLLMRAHAAGGRAELADAARAAAEERVREVGRSGDEGLVAQLAFACFDAKLWEHAARCYGDAIELRNRSASGRRRDDGTLGEYHERLAVSLSRCGRHAEAVDAAAGGVVAWGPHTGERQRALHTLEQILAAVPDLAAYGARLDAEAARTGLENPILRKALAAAWRQRGRLPLAQAQLEAALEAAPEDEELLTAQVELLDLQRRPAEAAQRLAQGLERRGHDLALLSELAKRFDALGEEERAERARTQFVEAFLGESEGHEALALERERAARHAEAAVQWREVIELRASEPTGWLGLARALVAHGDHQAAREPLAHLLATTWDPRFGDIHAQARHLLR